ncbi:glycosyltransferase family 39 protein [Xylona heveae TC161]|uniref:Dolichyl-phosphate-mannose--protein mannosyltransferase n=1 Tax=Xylona heveae (strain CBS 132557 / TC161) TaxID=1328760 RepID=A0A165AI50_XYLHT|nr:glycosyltransferase family 39 protein [Xylona heveae TC161]KZF20515.1 glycosyltransferase family 39 protein [Xylona heveae TC161]
MARRSNSRLGSSEKRIRGSSKSPGRSSNLALPQPPSDGKHKGYTSDGVSDHDIFLLPGSDFRLVGFLTALATIVRLFRIYQPSSVVFDEVHFGGFASKYIKGRFFMDVHPPLAKLLLTLAGWIAGFDGNFDFKDIGKDYLGPGVPYVAMRLLPAICGVLTVPTMFMTLKATGCRTNTAALGAGLLIFENALVTQSRFILLDSPLIIFTAFTALAWTSFTNQHEQGPTKAFQPSWWFWLVATGFGLGATASVKWVGLFTIAWVGGLTLVQLWVLLGDPQNVTPRLWFKHFFARAFCLIIVPVTFYLAMFAIHFLCLVNPGEGDGFMSSEFQATLNSKAMQDVPADVVLGSRVSIRHHNTQGGYLHSHGHMYPTGSKQQQITLYPHKDDNNLWLLENQTQPEGTDGPIPGPRAWDNFEPTFIQDGSVIKLYHLITDRRLHSHDLRPPVTEADWQNEVSAYGYEGFEGDANDLFRVEIVKSMSEGAEAKARLRTIQTKFKLVHIMSGCVLFSHKVKLPDWGYEQQEVTCAKGGTLPNSVWYIEQNEHPLLGEASEKVNYRHPGFFGKFWELQKVMWTTNAGLVESHAWDSRPPSWPILRRGINFWGRDHRQIYLIGNPLIWWTSSAAIATYVLFKAFAVLRWQRGYKDYSISTFKRFDYEIGTTVLGWALHYFPFYLMQRQLFLHHYLPALYFAIIALCQIYDFITGRFQSFGLAQRPAFGQAGAIIFLALSIAVFSLYAPLAYGNPWTQSACRKVKLFDTWDWDCNTFYTDLAHYEPSMPVVAETSHAGLHVSQPQENAGPAYEQSAESYIEEDSAHVTPQKAPDLPLLRKEQRLEYRDQDGNILNEEQIAALEGKVSFSTRYETRTRVLDGAGNVVLEGSAGTEAPALPHPEVQGENPETESKAEESALRQPVAVAVDSDLIKEQEVIDANVQHSQPQPASGEQVAT